MCSPHRTMSTKMYSGIYEGNWSYSFYGDQQGIAITERKGQTEPFAKIELNSNAYVSTDKAQNTLKDVHLLDSLNGNVKQNGFQGERDTNLVARKNNTDAEGNVSHLSPDTPRPGSGQVLDRNIKLNEPLQYRERYNKYHHQQNNLNNNPTNENEVDSEEKYTPAKQENAENGRAYDRTKQEIEQFRRRLREKAHQQNRRQKEHAQQRQVLQNWVLKKSNGQRHQRSQSTSDLPRIGRSGFLEDIVEDEIGGIEKGQLHTFIIVERCTFIIYLY